MLFDSFTNPFKNPADVSEEYRQHPSLQKLFQPDGSYTRSAEDPVTLWMVDQLHRNYNVPLEAMELELVADFAPTAQQSGSGRRNGGLAEQPPAFTQAA
jgi:type I restriction enzyme M protein